MPGSEPQPISGTPWVRAFPRGTAPIACSMRLASPRPPAASTADEPGRRPPCPRNHWALRRRRPPTCASLRSCLTRIDSNSLAAPCGASRCGSSCPSGRGGLGGGGLGGRSLSADACDAVAHSTVTSASSAPAPLNACRTLAISRGCEAQLAEHRRDVGQRGGRRDVHHRAVPLAGLDFGLLRDGRRPPGERRRRLRHRRRLADDDGQAPVHDRHRRQPDVAAGDDGPGPLVDDDARAPQRRDVDVLEGRDEVDDAGGVLRRQLHDHGPAVERAGRGIELLVDGFGDAGRYGEARGPQLEPDRATGHDLGGHVTLHERTLRDTAGRRRTRLDVAPRRAVRGVATHEQAALRHGIGLLIGSLEDGLHEDAAGEAPRVADRRHGHVDLGARLREGREGRRDGDRGDVAEPELAGADLDPQPAEHREHRLLGEGDHDVVAGAGEAGHDAEPDELVLARTGQVDEVAQVVGLRRPRRPRAYARGRR